MGQYKHYIFKTEDGNYILEAISGWLPIKYKQITNQHRLFDLADTPIEAYGKKKCRQLRYFTWGHVDYSMNQVMQLTYPEFFINEDEKLSFISGVVGISNNMGFSVEISDDSSAVRLFRERRLDNGNIA